MKTLITALIIYLGLAQAIFAMDLSLSSQTLRLGDVIRLDVHSNTAIKRSNITFNKKRFELFLEKQSGNQYHYMAYIAASRKATPGHYTLKVDIQSTGIESVYQHYKITLDYPAKRDTGKVNLSKSGKKAASDRSDYQKEGALLAKVFSTKSNTSYIDGAFKLPAKGRFSSAFAKLRTYNNGSQSSHAGLDISNKRGTTIVAPEAGKVVLSQSLVVHGNIVAIDHGFGVQSVFAHLDSRLVKEGDIVKRGQKIGKMGDTGVASGVHVHWGVSVQNVRVDPVFWLDKRSHFL